MEEKELNKKEKRTLLIVSLIVVIALVFGISYAYFMAVGQSSEQTITTKNLSITFGDGTDIINNSGLTPILSSDIKTQAAKKEFTVTNNSNSSMMYLNIGLDNIQIDEELKDKYFKWELYEITSPGEDNIPVNTGTFKVVGSKKQLTTTMLIENETKEYELYIYIEESGELQNAMMNKTFRANIVASGSTELNWNDYPEIIKNEKMAVKIFRNINVSAGASSGTLGVTDLNYSNTEGEVLNLLLKTNDTTGTLGSKIVIRQGSTTNRAKYVSYATYQGDGYYLVSHTYKVDAEAPTPYYMIDFRNSTSSIVVEAAYLGLDYIPEDTNSIKIAYVSPTGNDNNLGTSENSPLLTFSAAINTGANIILAKPGEYVPEYIKKSYYDNTNALSSSLEIYPYEKGNFSNKQIILKNGVVLDELTTDSDGLLTTTFTKISPIIWQIHDDISDDTKLVSTDSKENCIATAGTYYADGTNIYINPYDTNYNNFVFHNTSNLLRFGNYDKIIFKNITILHGNAMFTNTNKVNLINFHVKYAIGDDTSGIKYVNANGNIYDSTTYKSNLDGFNIHSTSEKKYIVNLYNCIGSYNYDDGVSHHDTCGGEIVGGEYSHNVKGGVIPISIGQKIYIKNLATLFNDFGIDIQSSGETSIFNIHNVISKNNNFGIRVAGDPIVNAYNLTLENNTTNSQGNYTEH